VAGEQFPLAGEFNGSTRRKLQQRKRKSDAPPLTAWRLPV